MRRGEDNVDGCGRGRGLGRGRCRRGCGGARMAGGGGSGALSFVSRVAWLGETLPAGSGKPCPDPSVWVEPPRGNGGARVELPHRVGFQMQGNLARGYFHAGLLARGKRQDITGVYVSKRS